MSRSRQLALWFLIACASVAALGLALRYSRPAAQLPFGAPLPPQPVAGRRVFQQKGCGNCHGADATGGGGGPDLRQRASLTSPPKLVVALWNHAPHMWAAMESRHLEYPSLNYQETSQLIAYLYFLGIDDNPGDSQRGALFWNRNACARCHGTRTEDIRQLAASLDGGALDWTQELWNHSARMRTRMSAEGLSWPHFGPDDVRDLLAFLRQQSGRPFKPDAATAADPDRGWLIFQQKGCIRCHSVTTDDSGVGPSLSNQQKLPPTLSVFGASLLNHIPQMDAAISRQGAEWPVFSPNEVRDLTVFFYGLRYLEPGGSPQIGRTVFSWRGCARCHGAAAEGGSAPGLRAKGTIYSSARLATDLWRHGRSMYRQVQREGQPWPELEDSDVGNLLAFLNGAP